MKSTVRALILAACLTAAAAPLAHAAPSAATAPLSPTGLTGMWSRTSVKPVAPIQLTPLAKAAEDKHRAELAAGNVIGDRKCNPVGMPGLMSNDFALQILEIPGRVVIVSEMSPLTRQVYLDKPQQDGGNGPMWNGHSVGHWEGKTLVIDTINFQEPESPIVFGGIRSSKLHLVERYHLEDEGQTLVGELTFEDPTLLLAPYKTVIRLERLANDAELWEYACLVDDEGWQSRFKGDTEAKAPVK